VERETRLRLLGLLPLVFVALQLHHHWSRGRPADILWACNVCDATLALGLLANAPVLVRPAALWLLLGIPLWVLDMALTGDCNVPTFLSHIGGLTVGLAAVWKLRAAARAWRDALAGYLFLQLVCRFATPPELNVNVAHRQYDNVPTPFAAYWQYWLVTTLAVAACLWLANVGLQRVFPPLAAHEERNRA